MLEPQEVRRWERMTAAMLQHAATDDPEAFAQVVKVLDDARAQLPEVAEQLRAPAPPYGPGMIRCYSWGDLARPLGITRQACQQRYGKA